MMRLRYPFIRLTTAQEAGLWMLLMSISFIPRPFAFALQTLHELHNITISPQVFGAALALCGGYLMLRKRVGRIRFVFLFAPACGYAVCLTWSFALTPTIGFLGSGFALWCCLRVIRDHARDETRREAEGG